ncbi:BLUF domain-containing protein [Beggiatoa leptomitoformis]|uniref:BLUF domain-containing protein n=1 Tax=Beggiatoa leptomitoformis TaxID=288004 RepID=A0A2N9YHB1_9GAMM|nr:BLUF domain-containing protein [Beggiatoa leptomitoformis]AUI69606.1 hypothetical protein BLE401_13510 [Beggiatoa leptomitoformis]QGX03700.1 hypothetical protein AL038_10760 [Beggiatoa leptomitoformis]
MSEHNLSCLSYASTATAKCSSPEIGFILEKAIQNNAQLNITGALFLGNNYFLQFLEGSRININLLFRHIVADDRHTNVQVLEFREIGSRSFEEWSMKHVRSPSVMAKIMRETKMREFNPYLLDTFSLHAMADAFRNHLEPDVPNSTFNHKSELVVKKKGNLDILKMFGKHSS